MVATRSPLITCVVPTLNSAATLDMTLQSLRNQQHVKVNIVVADSGSTDGTLRICERWAVPVVYVEPGNMYRAINVALKECNTPWLAYVNSDDWIYSDTYARLIACGQRTDADVVYGHSDYTDVHGRFLCSFAAGKPWQLLALFHFGILPFAQPAAIFRKSVYRRLNGFDERYFYSADAEFYIRAVRARFRFALVDGRPVACFRFHDKQLSNTRRTEMREEWRTIFRTPDLNPKLSHWLVLAHWRIMNLGHDLLRVARVSLMSRRLRFPVWRVRWPRV